MIIINTIDEQKFSLNGKPYRKIYQPLAQGETALSIVNKYDVENKLINSTTYDEFRIDSVAPTSQSDAMAKLLNVIFYSNELEDYLKIEELGYVTPEQFGAIGNGAIDDSAALQAAIDTGKTVVLADKVYSVNSINLTTHLKGNGLLRFNGENNGTCVTVTGSNLKIDIHFDMDLKNGRGLIVEGDYNKINVRVRNLTASATSSLSIYGIQCKGNYNRFGSVLVKDFFNTGQPNSSFPQGFIFSECYGNHIDNAHFENIDSAAMLQIGENEGNSIQNLEVHNSRENGLYHLSGDLRIGNMYYSGIDEAVVASRGKVIIDTLTVRGRANTIINIQNSHGLIINNISNRADPNDQYGYAGSFIRTRTTNIESAPIILRNIDVTISGVNSALMQLNSGTVESLTLENATFNYEYHTGAVSSFVDMVSVNRIQFDGVTTNFIDKTDSLNVGDFIRWVVNGNLLNQGYIRDWRFYGFDSDGITERAMGFRGTNFAQENLECIGLSWRGSLQSYVNQNKKDTNLDISDTIPTAGYWHKGKILYKSNPSAGGDLGWICVTAGSPGTWKSIGSIQA